MITCYLRYIVDPDKLVELENYRETKCFVSYKRSFFRPVFRYE